MTVATAAGQPVNEGRVERAGRSDFSTCAATLSFQRRRKPPSTKGAGASVTVQVPPPQCRCRFPVWVQPTCGRRPPTHITSPGGWQGRQTGGPLVTPILALGLELGGGGERVAGMHNALDSCLPYIPDVTEQPCH